MNTAASVAKSLACKISIRRDEDFVADAVKTMRFQPRFEVGQSGELLFKRASQTSPEIINFLREYVEQANK
jgi:hypothetical protein